MSKFLSEIKVTVYGKLMELNFQDTEGMVKWLDAEEPFWKEIDLRSKQSNLRNRWWTPQRNFYASIRNQLQQFEKEILAGKKDNARQANESLHNLFSGVSDGKVITSDYEIYPVIVDMAKIDLDVAGLLYLMAKSDTAQSLGNLPNSQIPVKTLLKFILLYTRSKGTKDWLMPQRKELTVLKDEYSAHLSKMRAEFEEQTKKNDEQQNLAEKTVSNCKEQFDLLKEQVLSEWNGRKKDHDEEWNNLKKVYDEQLALEAPTQYWRQRATSHKEEATKFARRFGWALFLSIIVFILAAMPLFDIAREKDVSLILSIFPYAVPAFGIVWVLKILSRLFSDNVQMMRDACERETMVKTFLALMRDGKDGKLIDENDRILILHALFRPSSVTGIDDSPPVHWFDILTNYAKGGK